jgi:ParB family transcriptional regulator, chromosome partitioning protein
MTKRKIGGLGTGRGLGALLPMNEPSGVREIATDNIRQNPRQPRTYFDDAALDELAASIREHGVIQPLIVSKRDEDSYELIAGERRWRASQRAGLAVVPVIVRETTSQQLLELALIENVQRADLNALEEAHAYQSLKDEFGLSDEMIAQRLGKNSRESITNTRRLLNLAPEAQQALLKNQISAGHGRALLKLKTAEQQQKALEVIIADEWNVRDVERLGDLVREHGDDIEQALAMLRTQRANRTGTARRATPAAQPNSAKSNTFAAEDQEVKRQFERILATPVNVLRTERDVRVTIIFHTEEKLQEFFDLINSA